MVLFRGASYSGGSTTWTGKAEMGDYIAAYGFMLKYAQLLAPSKPIDLVLAGYSYGSLIVSYQPSVEDIQAIFSNPKANSDIARLLGKAKQITMGEQVEDEYADYYDNGKLGEIDDNQAELLSSSVNISFLMVSPILSWATGFVTLGSNLSKLWIQNRSIVTLAPDKRLPRHKTLIIYGTDDMFTSEKKLKDWSEKLKNAPDSQVDVVQIPGGGHFYIEQYFHQKIRMAIREWLGRG